jgi:hypothetical protein
MKRMANQSHCQASFVLARSSLPKKSAPPPASAGIMSVIVKNKRNGRSMALPRDARDDLIHFVWPRLAAGPAGATQ